VFSWCSDWQQRALCLQQDAPCLPTVVPSHCACSRTPRACQLSYRRTVPAAGRPVLANCRTVARCLPDTLLLSLRPLSRNSPALCTSKCRPLVSSFTDIGQQIRTVRVSLSVKCACHRTDLHGVRHNCYTVFGENRTDCVVCDTTSQTDGWTWSACKSLSLCKEGLNLSTEFNSHGHFNLASISARARDGGERGDSNVMTAEWHCRLCRMSYWERWEVCGSDSAAAAWLTVTGWWCGGRQSVQWIGVCRRLRACWDAEAYLHSFSTSALYRGERSGSRSGRFAPGKRASGITIIQDGPWKSSPPSVSHVSLLLYLYQHTVVFLFNTVMYVFLLLGLCVLIVRLPWLSFFRAFVSVVLQMPGYNSPRRGTARSLPKFLCCSQNCCVVLKIVVLFYVLFVLCRSVYCLCVNVYCTTATAWQPNCS
jgi:hypothetical protein